jgi:hypothetical protein
VGDEIFWGNYLERVTYHARFGKSPGIGKLILVTIVRVMIVSRSAEPRRLNH